MNKVVAIADKASAPVLGLIALANLLLVASLFVLLFLAAPQAHAASEAVCQGNDLLSELQANDPDRLAELRREAARTPNGEGLLWKIEKDGAEPSFLFGTMHLTDDRVTDLTPAARSAFDQAATVIIETTDILDQQKAALSLMAYPELMMLPGSDTLKTLLAPEDLQIVNSALDARGIPPGSIIKMQPWLLAAMVSIPACEHERRRDGLAVLDVKLAEDAQASGKPIAGLETGVSQLQAMASLPLELHLESLVQTLKLGDKIDDVFETLIVLYERGEIGFVWPLLKELLPTDNQRGYADFEKIMITARNHGMVANAETYLLEGRAFIAVGALHLPGEEGVVELLRKAGYRVTRAD